MTLVLLTIDYLVQAHLRILRHGRHQQLGFSGHDTAIFIHSTLLATVPDEI